MFALFCSVVEFFLQDMFLDKATERKILSFIIKCPSIGCQWTGELRSKDVSLNSRSLFFNISIVRLHHYLVCGSELRLRINMGRK